MNRFSDDIERFLDAQTPVYAEVLQELATGRKTSHWMWFIFPQLRALGRSGTAKFFGIESRAEAQAYWAHPVLGARLKECVELVLAAKDARSAYAIFGTPDELKLRSCMTLFDAVAPKEQMFKQVLSCFFGGQPDELTAVLLQLERT